MNRNASMSRTTRTTRTARTFRSAGRSALCAIAVTGLAFGVLGCSEAADKAIDTAVDNAADQTYEVTYEVTGTDVAEILYHGGGGEAMNPEIETVTAPALPWKKTVTLRGVMPASVIPVAADVEAAGLACTITYKGKVLEEVKGEELLTKGGCIAGAPILG